MKHYIIVILTLLIAMPAWAYSDADVYAYIEKYKSIALEQESKYGIPATITLAQGILESGAGKSSLTLNSNNHFGIKQGSSWKGRIYKAQDDEIGLSSFRVYSSAAESFEDHSKVLSNSRYSSCFQHSIYDYRSWAFKIKKAGYATAPNYAEALIGLIERYQIYKINNGAKLRPGKTVVITRFIDEPIDEEYIADENVQSEEEELIVKSMQMPSSINNVHCTVLMPGEVLGSISRKYDITMQDLLKYNDARSPHEIKEGDVVFLDQKKKKYELSQDVYVVKEGETLRDVAQRFGIRLENLAKRNKLYPYDKLEPGKKIDLK